MKLLTCSNARYLPRMRPYLTSLANHSPFDNVLLGVGCRVPPLFLEELLGVRAVDLPPDVLAGAPAETQSVQHGSWLPHVAGPESEVVIFTDGDIVLQRRPTPAETAWLASLGPDTVTAGPNSSPSETLVDEAARLFPRIGRAEMEALWGDIGSVPCYNIGVIAMQRGTWRRVHEAYMARWADACATFGGPARQQWLVCWAIHQLGLRVDLTPYSVHTHGCYPLPAGATFAAGELLFNGVPVLFRHHV